MSTILTEILGDVPDAARARADVLGMTGDAERAVLRPVDPGAIPHSLRAALAARVARLHDAPDLAERYAKDAGDDADLADPSAAGTGRDAAICAFIDKTAAQTARTTADDIEALKAAGIDDADIVRLAELGAFLAYQIRLIVGLRLLKEAP